MTEYESIKEFLLWQEVSVYDCMINHCLENLTDDFIYEGYFSRKEFIYDKKYVRQLFDNMNFLDCNYVSRFIARCNYWPEDFVCIIKYTNYDGMFDYSFFPRFNDGLNGVSKEICRFMLKNIHIFSKDDFITIKELYEL